MRMKEGVIFLDLRALIVRRIGMRYVPEEEN